MEINRLMFNYIKQNIPKESLKEDSIFQGNIVDIDGDLVLINIPGQGIIEAESNLDLEKYLGETIKFIVKSQTDTSLEIKPMIEELIKSPEDELDRNISRLLKENNLKESDLSRELVKNLMEMEIPLSEENISKSIKTLEKLQEFMELEDENIEILDLDIEDLDSSEYFDEIKESNFKDEKESLLNELKLLNRKEQIQENILETSREELKSYDGEIKESNLDKNLQIIKEELASLPELEKELDVDIRNILIKEDSSELPGKSEFIVKENLDSLLNNISEDELINISSFMTKHNVKPSLNNIKNLHEFMEDPFAFMEELLELSDMLADKEIKMARKLEIPEDKDLEDKKSLDILKEDLSEIETKGKVNLNDKEKMLEIRNKTEFIKDLNKDMYFHIIPINYGEKKLDGFINIVKNKKKNKDREDGKLNIFINLDTENMGNIRVSCQAKFENLNIKISVSDEDRNLFEASKTILIERIEKLGFNVERLDFPIKKDLNFVDDMKAESKQVHFLDIKV